MTFTLKNTGDTVGTGQMGVVMSSFQVFCRDRPDRGGNVKDSGVL